MTPVVLAQQLTKSYGPARVVDHVSFDVKPNEVMGLLGPNGSGKSTILRMLTGFLRPTSGTAQVAGFDVVTQSLQARSRIGYVAEDVPLYPAMRVKEFLLFMGRVRGISARALPSAVDRVVERLSLRAVCRYPIFKLSRGYRQRVAIAQALLGEPALLVLDEPTNGLDPRQIIELRELIRSLSGELAILATSHILAEIERVAHRVAILLNGRLLAIHPLSGPNEMRPVHVHLRGASQAKVRAALGTVPGASVEWCSPSEQEYLVRAAGGIAVVAPALAGAGLTVEEASLRGRELETVFLQLTEASGR